jgi:hypothetical protein
MHRPQTRAGDSAGIDHRIEGPMISFDSIEENAAMSYLCRIQTTIRLCSACAISLPSSLDGNRCP